MIVRILEREPVRRAQKPPVDERLSLERMALMSDDRSRMNPRRELDILALTGAAPVSDGAIGRLEIDG